MYFTVKYTDKGAEVSELLTENPQESSFVAGLIVIETAQDDYEDKKAAIIGATAQEGFNWDRLPSSEEDTARAYIKDGNKKGLLGLYNQYKLAPYSYDNCCLEGLLTHFKERLCLNEKKQ